MSFTKRKLLIELEYMNRGLIPRNVKSTDVTSDWTPTALKTYHRKFRKVFRRALKWESKNLISVVSRGRANPKEIIRKYLDENYYASWSYPTSEKGHKAASRRYMMASRRRLVHRYICWLVDCKQTNLMKKKSNPSY